ncbi:MAG TPA: acetyl-CoA carboxylase biotin carboxyl carrier protein [Candidatus Izemoplasmatales bacterium]|nr:acetyl-CoA carboxylase biotin carboxyl carrier protein [Candidatus Izemoplasmatales bacterium]
MDIKNFRRIVKEFEKSSIHKLEISEKDFTVKMEKKVEQMNPVAIEKQVKETKRVSESYRQEDTTNTDTIKSPLVGTYYESPSPDSSPYITVGQTVKEGDILCVIEAMKVMNEIRSPMTGVVKSVHVRNDSMVEYGQALIEIEAV